MTIYMAWKKSDSNSMYWTYFSNGHWHTEQEQPTPIPGFTTSVGPGLTSLVNDKLRMAWKTASGDAIHWATYSGKWTTEQPARDFVTTGQPALLGSGMAWKGGDDQSIFWSSTSDGTHWDDRTQAQGMGSSVGPALGHYLGTPYMAWKGAIGVHNDQSIYWSTLANNQWVGQQQVPGVGSNVGPALAETPNGLLMAWKGAWDDDRIWWTIYNGGWADQKLTNFSTSVGPALVSTSTGALMTWKADNNESIWWATFDNLHWGDQRQIPRVDTSYRPALTSLG